MRLEWVKQQLLRRGAAAVPRSVSHLGNSPSTGAKSSAYVIAEAMEPAGCSCVLAIPRRSPENANGATAVMASTVQPTRQQRHRPSSTHVRHRVTLPGMTPGTVLRTRAAVAEWMRATRQLPSPEQYTVVVHNGHRTPAKARGAVALPALPCRRAAAQTCVRCPWMALQEGHRSMAAKQKAWRTSLVDAVRNRWSAVWATAKQDRSANSPPNAPHTYADVVDCFSFLEPLAVPVASNHLQALQLVFRRRPQQQPQAELLTATRTAGQGYDLPRDVETASRAESSALVELIREGDLSSGEGGPADVGHSTAVQGDCLLETLEQKRLVVFLQRWAARLPASTQERLQGVFLSQPSRIATTTTATTANTPFSGTTSSLQVVLVVERNPDVLGLQSPLCGPAHPVDLLSAEEQQLVGVVAAAAPLLTDVEVVVCICGGDASTHADVAASDFAVHVLYPTLDRAGSLAPLSQRERDDATSSLAEEHGESQRKMKRPLESSAALDVRCWCEPLGRELQTHLVPYHAALSAVRDIWLTSEGREKATRLTQGRPSRVPALFQTLPWVPTLWRHPNALDTCCSVLMSMLFEEMEGEEETPVPVANATAQQPPIGGDIVLHTTSSATVPRTDPASIGAIAGQRILDAALRSFVQMAKDALHQAETRSAEGGASRTPRRVFLSVKESSTEATVSAAVEAVATASCELPIRLCLYTCTSSMKTERLSAAVASITQTALTCGNAVRVRAGVIDVDPLSSSYVAYAQVDLTSRPTP